MTVAEALTNLVFARVSTLKVYSDVFSYAACAAITISLTM